MGTNEFMSDLRLSLLAIGIVVLIAVYFISGRTVRQRSRREFKLRHARKSADIDNDDVLRDYFYEPVAPSRQAVDQVFVDEPDAGSRDSRRMINDMGGVLADDIVISTHDSRSAPESLNITGAEYQGKAAPESNTTRQTAVGGSGESKGKSPLFFWKKRAVSSGQDVKKKQRSEIPAVKEMLVIMFIIARDEAFDGIQIDNAMARLGLERDHKGMYQLSVEDDNGDLKPLLGVANALEPGVIDFENLASFDTTGLVVFMQLPGPWNGVECFDRMIELVRILADILGAEVRDDSHSVLTVQTLGHLREKIRDHDLRVQLAQARHHSGIAPRL